MENIESRRITVDMSRYFQKMPVGLLINISAYLLKPEQVFFIDFMAEY